MQFWNDFEGEGLGGYPLQKLVRSEGRNAWFETQTESGAKALLSVTESLNDDHAILERLEAARKLEHENILRVTKVGQGNLNGTPLVYALMDPVEENLGDVLRERALGTAETETIARSLITALVEMHKNGVVHGRVEPASVLAIGDTIKMRSDCVQLAKKVALNGHDWTGVDFRGLGATLYQCLTQRTLRSPEDPHVKNLPAPYAEIVANSLAGNWTSAEVLRALEPAVFKPRTAAQAVAADAPVAKPVVSSPLLDDLDEPRERTWGLPKRTPLYAGIAVVVLLLVVWLVVRAKSGSTPAGTANAPRTAASSSAQPNAAASGAVPVPTTAPPPSTSKPSPITSGKTKPGKQSAGARVVVPLNPTPAPAPSNPAPAVVAKTPAPGPASGEVWRVVAFTYKREDQAQHKADELNGKHPGLGASVFHSSNGRDAYLVTLGGGMDREAALKMRDHVRGIGLPRDTYAQNFKE